MKNLGNSEDRASGSEEGGGMGSLKKKDETERMRERE